jgi:hypothetical protein
MLVELFPAYNNIVVGGVNNDELLLVDSLVLNN